MNNYQQVQRREVTIAIPAGVEYGQTIRTSIPTVSGAQELFVTLKYVCTTINICFNF